MVKISKGISSKSPWKKNISLMQYHTKELI